MSNLDPYQPPKSDLSIGDAGLAGRGVRFVVALIDGLISDVLFIFRKDRRCVHDLIAGTQVVRITD